MTNEHIANAIRLEADNNRLHELVKGQSQQIKRLQQALDNLLYPQYSCLEALDSYSSPDGVMCVPFAQIERSTGYERSIVRRIIRQLAREGYAEYFRGLWSEDGEPAGSGYCITKGGQSYLRKLREGSKSDE